MVRGRESERCIRFIRLAFAISAPATRESETQSHGKSQAMKLTAAIAIPTPKRTPARTRFEPPSPKANVRPDTTIATRERPRAIVLVKACWRTPTAFSQGEAPWAKAGATKSSPRATAVNCRNIFLNRRALFQSGLIFGYLLVRFFADRSLLESSRRNCCRQETPRRSRQNRVPALTSLASAKAHL